MRAVAVVLTVFAVLSAATGIDQAYGEYATIGSLLGQDTYREADLTGMAKRSDLISVTQWKQEKQTVASAIFPHMAKSGK